MPIETHQIVLGGKSLQLDLQNRHEKDYLAHFTKSSVVPQIKIDELVLNRLLKHGATLLDIGANIGYTALSALDAGYERICCIEPHPIIYSRLKRLDGGCLSTHELALGNKIGQIDFYSSKIHNQGSTYHLPTLNKFRAIFDENLVSIKVSITTLDAFLTEQYDVWKIDAEGAELDILLGASKILRYRPPHSIYMEIWDSEQLRQIQRILDPIYKHHYRVFVSKNFERLQILDLEHVWFNRKHDKPAFFLRLNAFPVKFCIQ